MKRFASFLFFILLCSSFSIIYAQDNSNESRMGQAKYVVLSVTAESMKKECPIRVSDEEVIVGFELINDEFVETRVISDYLWDNFNYKRSKKEYEKMLINNISQYSLLKNLIECQVSNTILYRCNSRHELTRHITFTPIELSEIKRKIDKKK